MTALKVTRTEIDGVLVIEPRVHGDERGFFIESFNQRDFDETVGRHVTFVQDNHSRSAKGVLRGLHYQVEPLAQEKLVWVTHGSVWDVAVDLRPASPTFGRWIGHELSAQNFLRLWIPAGLAHGFLVTSDWAEVQYKASSLYAPQAEGIIRWDDPALAIRWPLQGDAPVLSSKDAGAPNFAQRKTS